MANKKISDLPAVGILYGTELVALSQGVSRRSTLTTIRESFETVYSTLQNKTIASPIITGTEVNQGAAACSSFSFQVPTTGFSIAMASNIGGLILEPAGTLAAGTITLPASPVDGQLVSINSTQTITALTVAASAGKSIKNAPTALTISTTAGQGYRYIYRSSNTTWYRLQ